MDTISIPPFLRALVVKPLEWKLCNVPNPDELVLIAMWTEDGYDRAVYADFFEPRCFYRRKHFYGGGYGVWEGAEMDRPTL
jgi:hypothetical protein